MSAELSQIFNLKKGKAEDKEILATVVSGVNVRGTNLYILAGAILIASIGLNMNSPAIVIGAMLISPLMGAILSIAYSFVVGDIKLLKKSYRSLFIQVSISILVSTVYFLLTPLKGPTDEILARTNPTIWDVIIATVGGFVGAIAITRKEKSNVIPGVAIATALMPPLCVAGYGLSQFNIYYFFGAIYLFFINSFFIALSSSIVLKYLDIKYVSEYKDVEKVKCKRIIIFMTILTVLPSLFFSYQAVNDSILEKNINKFLLNEVINNSEREVTNKKVDRKNKEISFVVFGKTLTEEEVNKLNKDKINYNLGDMKLNIHQNFTMEDLLDKENLNSFKSYLDVNEKNKNISIKTLKNQENRIIELEKKYNELQKGIDNEFLKTLKEIKVLYPNITQIEAGAINYSLLMESNIDNKKIFLIKSNNDFSENEKNLIKEWLTVKLESNVEVFFTKN